MIYREWFSLRLKLTLWLVIYFGALLVYLASNVWLRPMTVNIYREAGQDIYNTLFGGWLKVITGLTPVLALLGAMDLISEEAGKGTISFLLTRPLTRTRIYVTKILLSAGSLVAVCGISSLPVLLLDQIPRPTLIHRWAGSACGENAYCEGWVGNGLEPSRPTELVPALAALGIVLAVGALIVFGTALFSIFTKSMLQTLALSAPLLFITYVVLNGSGPFGRTSQYQPMDTVLVNWTVFGGHLKWMAGLTVLSVFVFMAGLVAFNRKEL